MSLEIDVSEDKRRSGWQYQECNQKRRVMGGVLFARDGIEKPGRQHEDQNGETG